jgi:hypothetical protein
VDHIAVTRDGGVWAIDAKNYTAKVHRIDKGRWFSPDERLYVGSFVPELVGARVRGWLRRSSRRTIDDGDEARS